ncbi:MAG: 5-formyltetrahydrofolate cyclo-ligase [Pyrinomonadaceae bacterium]
MDFEKGGLKKKELRKLYAEKYKRLSRDEIERRSNAVTENLFKYIDFSGIEFVHLFLSIEEKSETDTTPIIAKFRGEYPNIKLVVPRVNAKNDKLEHIQLTLQTDLTISSWGIPEPEDGELIDEGRIDAVLVPMVCFDEGGERVGHGKGYYDKFLSKCKAGCKKIGISMFPPVERIEDIREFDVRLDFCVTPEKVWNFVDDKSAN